MSTKHRVTKKVDSVMRASNFYSSLMLFMCVFGTTVCAKETKVVVNVDSPKWTISDHLVGLHMVYTNAKDKAYKDGKVARWVKSAGVSTARYPGGTIVKYWDWRKPTGVMTGDHWDPKWDKKKNEPSDKWMSLDEYLKFVKNSGITPLFGVNSLSGYEHNRMDESIKRAAGMVAYVKKKGFGGAFWYIGNEEGFHYKGKIAEYAEVFKKHASAMKKIDPKVKIFWNNNNPNASTIKTFLEHDGGTSDGLETHGKWPYGGKPKNGLGTGSYSEWLNEFELRDRKNRNRKWRLAGDEYRKAAADCGREDYLIANNEYGYGNISTGFNRYTKGLLMTDLLQELFIGNWDMSCFWDNCRGDSNGLMSGINDFRLNPLHLGMDLLADAQGGTMLEVTSDNNSVYGFAAKVKSETLIYLINKTESPQKVAISLSQGKARAKSARVMKDTPDHWGKLDKLTVKSGDVIQTTLPPLSYSQIRL